MDLQLRLVLENAAENIVPETQERSAYLACIRPHLEYACQLWDPYTHHDIQLLEYAQTLCLQGVFEAIES